MANLKIASLTESARMHGVDYFLDNPSADVKATFPEFYNEEGNINFALFSIVFGKALEKKAYVY